MYVQREQLLLDKTDLAELDKPRAVETPEIIVRSATVSEADKPTRSNPGVRIRQKSPVSNHMHKARKSWRQTPVIAPDVVEMILTGEIFESEDGEESCENPLLDMGKKLETCVEVDETVSSRKFSPVTSRKATPILKSTKSSSLESSPTTTEKHVSISSEPVPSQRPVRRKFLSADERSRTIEYAHFSSIDKDNSPPSSPDLLSKSMDLRGAIVSGSDVQELGQFSRLRVNSLSHSLSTPDLTKISTEDTKKEAKAKRVERSHSKRIRTRNDAYLDSTQILMDAVPSSPRRRTGGHSFSPRHSASSIASRLLTGTGINRAFSSFRKNEKDVSSSNKGSRTLS
jgi:hypothetical protein